MSYNIPEGWEAVIGLEIHVGLNTASKLFSGAPNRFGDEPNTNITGVCTGEPGALPVLNEAAVEKAVRFGCAVGGDVQHFSTFDRKSYFYPDTPRNYQITQFFEPILRGGTVTADVGDVPMTFAIESAHLEDDAGMLKHFSTFAGVDYNRAGIPLLEIVSEPCMHSPQEAVAYATMIRAIMHYIDASDCNMEEGSLRFDANISVRKKGEKALRNKIEIKNMNSFSFMEMAVDAEIHRQIKEYIKNGDKDHSEVITSATYRWDSENKKTVLMRRKEEAHDYRYFPEPDLLPIQLSDEYIKDIRKTLPELPYDKEKRYLSDYDLSHKNAAFLVSEKTIADYFEEGLKACSNAKNLCSWIIVEFAGRLKDTGKNITDSGISAKNVASLVNLIDEGTITGKIAKKVADDMLSAPEKSPADIVAENPEYQPVHDEEEIEKLVDAVIAENTQAIENYKAGNKRAFGSLVGAVMKLSNGKASPQVVNSLLHKKISS
ncbi:MAG: Asp-tRNA(Asn)/Glu-tRNA(Gln) amidotransferase subunit GatB [Waddliaceae bacterium]|jgi:aspartyl-tRNA(Asn)/glutamyl-tRNA(Gln) amidotransferase subunit B|nr:Asp-tRNA(Asn)/Glu-tRNA(Gln) amidotransferase subunit GatB [Waddliaceae bacterium]MBT3578615.1 Asp-tRNA(Asn)/Glu-tRNA(Gln) amidotransferase subunit GatB [Waddliaceae bacterium]MBT4445541.1 Asp-tRNA(Asn)/Glu-tRNA(Gln) amidotransferase subunit GatB [Waddliaceae bacterium]MBT6928398.1 Asp-tRNA(Asn)/Glu-tRNA(Gln) amidotransferase subunit GatB [Waddliaceae bacterium]MBT7265084.1 Asp-tRNA(Asn)/Glu-tRNA(Gln) amidotransferase subunit GatB [Waddliaceae bacterium]